MVTYVRPATPVHVDPAQAPMTPQYPIYSPGVIYDQTALRVGHLETRIEALTRQVEDQAGMISGLQHQFELLEQRHRELAKRVNQMAEERADAEPYEQLVFTTKDGQRVKVTVQDA